MAEALAVVSAVASIVQLVDFSSKLLSRLNEFHSSAGEVPKSFRHLKAELPVLLETLQQLRQAIEGGSVTESTKKALVPAIESSRDEIEQLNKILERVLTKDDENWLKKGKKVFISLKQDAKVEQITKTLRGYIGTLTFYCAVVSSTHRPIIDKKLPAMRQWLSAPDPSTNYYRALKQRQPDTGAWLLELEQYTNWKTCGGSPLWLYGIPGAGKTILSATVLQDVLQYCEDDPGKVVAYFYFDFQDAEKQKPELMIYSLICQLLAHSFEIPAGLDSLFSTCNNGQRKPSTDALMGAMKDIVQQFPHTYLVIDAPDESGDREELMDNLETMASWQLDNFHLLMTSRKERDIEETIESFVKGDDRICLQSRLVDADIQKYVRQRLVADKKLSKWQKDPAIREEIENAIMEGAHGMFRWAACQLDTLAKCRNRFQLRTSLRSLPSTLDETYSRILCAIDEQDSQYALRILRWLCFSVEPLSVEEVAEVVAIDFEREPAFDRDEVLEDPMEISKICSSLVTMSPDVSDEDWNGEDDSVPDRESFRSMVRLAHYSVKEYLVSPRIVQGRAARYSLHEATSHEVLACSCIGYLLQFRDVGVLSEENLEDFPLATYSGTHWTDHARKVPENSAELNQLGLRLLSKERNAYLACGRIWSPWPDDPSPRTEFGMSLEELPSDLYYASFFDLIGVVNLLLHDDHIDVNAPGGNNYGGHTALHAAAELGHIEIVKLLIENGAAVNVGSGLHSETPLYLAAIISHTRTVELLLKSGADVDRECGLYRNALNAATAGGSIETVKVLLEAGANVNMRVKESGTALHMASNRGFTEIVELLLEKGADVNAKGGFCGNVLQEASYNGHLETVELLLEKGADGNGGRHGTALQAACSYDHETSQVAQIVELLLENGANVNAHGGEFGTALQAASYQGRTKIVKLLLEKGADINTQGGEYGDALQAASLCGYIEVVKLLLEKGADVNAQGGKYGNALQTVSYRCHIKVVELLLEKGADVNAQGGKYENVLRAAKAGKKKCPSLAGDFDRTIQLLRRYGAREESNADEGSNSGDTSADEDDWW